MGFFKKLCEEIKYSVKPQRLYDPEVQNAQLESAMTTLIQTAEKYGINDDVVREIARESLETGQIPVDIQERWGLTAQQEWAVASGIAEVLYGYGGHR